jgi:dipeptidyl aminopeptidase/acylaminoacyl peptidase
MVGEKDFNVPAVGSEQMYQALRSQGCLHNMWCIRVSFMVFPVPSYQADRLARYIGWFDKYIKK